MGLVIGIDFDNTIISYDDVLFHLALERGLIAPAARKSKKHIRDTIRKLPGGELAWQKLQAILYGPAIGAAGLTDGVADFVRACRRRGAAVLIISHKTACSNLGDSTVNFRDAATAWMREHGFFRPAGLGFAEQDVYYEATRPDKVARIAASGCTHFIDDLEETFQEPTFPSGVGKLLYNPHHEPVTARQLRICANWDQIATSVFHEPVRC
jgi:hypothetical protein